MKYLRYLGVVVIVDLEMETGAKEKLQEGGKAQGSFVGIGRKKIVSEAMWYIRKVWARWR